MAQKILYFTAGVTATVGELADIAKLNAIAQPAYEVGVRSAVSSNAYGAGVEAADFVAGTIPEAYEEVDEIDPDEPPTPGTLPSNQTVVSDGQVIDTADGGTVTLTIEDGVITDAVYAEGE